MQQDPTLLSRLPPAALHPPIFVPDEEGADAVLFARSVCDAAAAIADCIESGELDREPRILKLLQSFAGALIAQVTHVTGLVEAGAGLAGRQLAPVLEELAAARKRVEREQRRLVDFARRAPLGVLAAIRAAAGIMKGLPADAMADERALYDG